MTLYFSKSKAEVEIRFSNRCDDLSNMDRPIVDTGLHLNKLQITSLMKFLYDNEVIDRKVIVDDFNDKSAFESEERIRGKWQAEEVAEEDIR